MPMLNHRWNGYRFAFPNYSGGLSFFLIKAGPLRYDEELTSRVRMPMRPRSWGEFNAAHDAVGFSVGPYESGNPNGSAKAGSRSLSSLIHSRRFHLLSHDHLCCC